MITKNNRIYKEFIPSFHNLPASGTESDKKTIAIKSKTIPLDSKTDTEKSGKKKFNYEVYLESWDSGWIKALMGMTPSLKINTLDIGFASYTFPGLHGIEFQNISNDTHTVIDYVHKQDGAVKLSYGGASYAGPNYFVSQTPGWPNNIPFLVEGIKKTVTEYNFDGIDFDIEDSLPAGITKEEFAHQLFTFLSQVRASLPGKTISLTIPGQGWGTYFENLAKLVAANETVNYINFMDYDIWIGAPSYVEQVQADLITYISPTTTSLGPNHSPGWGIPPHLIQLGMMPGNDDIKHFLSVTDAEVLTRFAISTGLFGVMIWDLNRDARTNPIPSLGGAGAYDYTKGIIKVIEDSNINQQINSQPEPLK